MKGQVVILGLEIHILDVNTLHKKKARNSTTLIHSQGTSRTGGELDLCAEKLEKHFQKCHLLCSPGQACPKGPVMLCTPLCTLCLLQDKVWWHVWKLSFYPKEHADAVLHPNSLSVPPMYIYTHLNEALISNEP